MLMASCDIFYRSTNYALGFSGSWPDIQSLRESQFGGRARAAARVLHKTLSARDPRNASRVVNATLALHNFLMTERLEARPGLNPERPEGTSLTGTFADDAELGNWYYINREVLEQFRRCGTEDAGVDTEEDWSPD